MSSNIGIAVHFKSKVTQCYAGWQTIQSRDGTGQHFCSPARPEVTRNHPARTVYAKPQIIFRPVARNITQPQKPSNKAVATEPSMDL